MNLLHRLLYHGVFDYTHIINVDISYFLSLIISY